MLITRTFKANGNLLPRANNVISSIPDEYLFHLQHGKLHPSSAYRRSLRAISEQFSLVLDQINILYTEHFSEGKESSFPSLMKEYKTLLYRLNEHFDACNSVLRSLCPPDQVKPIKLDAQFLSQAKLDGWKNFSNATLDYRLNHIGLLANKLKHDGAELNWIFLHSPDEFRPGYYLSDVLADGGTGPNPELHLNGNTAFSFVRDLKQHIWWLYRVSELLAEAITTAMHALHQFKTSDLFTTVENIELAEVVGRVAALRPEYFPDEMNKPQTRIVVPVDLSAITLEFPGSERGIRFKGEMQIKSGLRVDFNHPSMRLPYFGEQ